MFRYMGLSGLLSPFVRVCLCKETKRANSDFFAVFPQKATAEFFAVSPPSDSAHLHLVELGLGLDGLD